MFAERYGAADLAAFSAARAACAASFRARVNPALRALGALNPLAVMARAGGRAAGGREARRRAPEHTGAAR